jgi:ERCC4-type nuclease
MQKILKPENKLMIIADDRETASRVPHYLKEFGAIVNFHRLEVGDYIISDKVCIERKSGEDFVGSIINNRVFQQAEEMKNNFSRAIIIVEGRDMDGRISENAVKAAMATLMLKSGVDLVTTENEKETARLIFYLAKKEQDEFKHVIGIKGKKKPKELLDLQEHFISALPGISDVLSRRLLEHFKNVKAIINSSEEEIAGVKGIGKNNAKKLHEIFNKMRG